MKLLWNRDLKMNTVHILDVCRAVWHLHQHGKTKQIYHLADKSDTSEYVYAIFMYVHVYDFSRYSCQYLILNFKKFLRTFQLRV